MEYFFYYSVQVPIDTVYVYYVLRGNPLTRVVAKLGMAGWRTYEVCTRCVRTCMRMHVDFVPISTKVNKKFLPCCDSAEYVHFPVR